MKLKLFFTEGLPAELNKVRVVREQKDLSALRERRELRKDCLGSLVIASDQKVVQNERHRLMLFQVTVQSRQPERQVELITGTIAQALHGDLGLVGPDVDEETGGELTFNDVLSRDEEDPAIQAARKMDWETFMAGLSVRDQAVIEGLVEGTSGSAMARKLGVCSSTIQHRKRSLAKAVAAFMGDDILIEVRRLPRWKHDLDATKERQAVRYERAH